MALRLCSAQIVQNPIVLETFEMKCKWIKKTNVLNWSNMSIVCYYLIKWNGYDCSSKQPNVCETSAARLAKKKNPNKTVTQKSSPTGAYQGHKLMQIFFPCLFLFLEKKSKAKKSILCGVKVAITQGTMQHMKYWGWEIRT